VKIALIGTHGVGKTTLCFELAARLKRLELPVDLVKEVARDCPLPINRDTTLDAQSWILHAQCAREIAAAHAAEVVVCDRSVLDNYAYLVHAVGRRPELEPWIGPWCATYTGLFKVPVWQTPAFDGTRDTDLAFQREIDATLDDLIEAFGVKALRLSPGNPNGWVGEILKSLGLPSVSPQGQLFPDRS
jgi:nicotinamide riboside kinase